MKKLLLASCGAGLLLSACGGLSGGLYTNVKEARESYSEAGMASKVSGEHCAHSILGIVAMGDNSVETARADAGISKVAFVDQRRKSILSTSYNQICTQVSGE